MSDLEPILTPDAPRPGGHYSQAIVHDGLVWVAGLLPIEPASGEKVFGEIEEQTGQVLRNLAAILTAAGSSPDRVLRTTVYVADIALWGRVNAIYADFFGDHRPARTVVPVPELHYGFAIELDAVAAVGD
jgi:2-iminobutanoate/2-iminopropanoate deaminase